MKMNSDLDILTESEAVERFKLPSRRTVKTLRDAYGLSGQWRGRRMVYRAPDVSRAIERMNVSRNSELTRNKQAAVQNGLHDQPAQTDTAKTSRQTQVDEPMVRTRRQATRDAVRPGVGMSAPARVFLDHGKLNKYRRRLRPMLEDWFARNNAEIGDDPTLPSMIEMQKHILEVILPAPAPSSPLSASEGEK